MPAASDLVINFGCASRIATTTLLLPVVTFHASGAINLGIRGAARLTDIVKSPHLAKMRIVGGVGRS
jgi:hypothetical protein